MNKRTMGARHAQEQHDYFAEELSDKEDVENDKKESKDVDQKNEKKRKVIQKPRPRVTLDLLKGASGIDDIMTTFPREFPKQFKGKGHEVGDLRRLLEMYHRWGQRLQPQLPFDTILLQVEKLGTTNQMKAALNTVRSDLHQQLQPEPEPQRDVEQGADAPSSPQAGAADPAWDEDDELLELQAATWVAANDKAATEPAAVPPASHSRPQEDIPDEDELLDMLEEEMVFAEAPPACPAAQPEPAQSHLTGPTPGDADSADPANVQQMGAANNLPSNTPGHLQPESLNLQFNMTEATEAQQPPTQSQPKDPAMAPPSRIVEDKANVSNHASSSAAQPASAKTDLPETLQMQFSVPPNFSVQPDLNFAATQDQNKAEGAEQANSKDSVHDAARRMSDHETGGRDVEASPVPFAAATLTAKFAADTQDYGLALPGSVGVAQTRGVPVDGTGHTHQTSDSGCAAGDGSRSGFGAGEAGRGGETRKVQNMEASLPGSVNNGRGTEQDDLFVLEDGDDGDVRPASRVGGSGRGRKRNLLLDSDDDE